MLIFDAFPNKTDASEFAARVGEAFGLQASVHDDQDESDEIDPFPFELEPLIVLVERGPHDKTIERMAKTYHGEFAGT